MESKNEMFIFHIFFESLKIREIKTSTFLTQIGSITRQGSLEHLIKPKSFRKKDCKEDIDLLYNDYFISSKYREVSEEIFNSFKKSNLNTEYELVGFLFCMLLLTKDFSTFDQKKCCSELVNFFSLFKFKIYLNKDINNQYFADILDLYYFTNCFVNLVSLKVVKQLSISVENDRDFEGKYSYCFGYKFQEQLLIDLIGNKLLTDSDGDYTENTSSNKYLQLLKKFQKIDVLVRNETTTEMGLKLLGVELKKKNKESNSSIAKDKKDYNSSKVINQDKIEIISTLDQSGPKTPKAKFETDTLNSSKKEKKRIASNYKISINENLNTLQSKESKENKEINFISNNLNNISHEVSTNKDILFVPIFLYYKHVLSILKKSNVVRDTLIKFSRKIIKTEKW